MCDCKCAFLRTLYPNNRHSARGFLSRYYVWEEVEKKGLTRSHAHPDKIRPRILAILGFFFFFFFYIDRLPPYSIRQQIKIHGLDLIAYTRTKAT